MIKRLFLGICILLCQICLSQEKDRVIDSFDYGKNSLYVTYGSLGFTGALTVSYNRFIFKRLRFINPFLRLGYGKQYEFDDGKDREVYLVNAGILIGRNRHHFEGGLGIVNDFWKNGKFTNFLEPSGFAGYRLQNLNGKFPLVLRAGLGYPETLYVGVGVAF